MKRLISTICITSLVCGAFADDVDLAPLLTEEDTQEVVAQGPTLLTQPPAFAEFAQLPPPALPPIHKSPLISVGLSSLIPGLGHAYLGDTRTALGLFGGTCAGISAAVMSLMSGGVEHPAFNLSLFSAQAVWSYSVYAAYRDVRALNGASNYTYPMPTDTFSDVVTAPFRWSVMKKPEVWGGILGALALGTAVMYFGYPHEARIQLPHLSAKDLSLHPAIALPVAIGEESAFRGYMQSYLSETFSPNVGLAVSSLAFGAVHIPNAMSLPQEERWRYYSFSIPLITGLGAYLGWVTQRNHSLKESVAIHAWYDFVVMGIGAWASQSVAGRSDFSMVIPF